jgi:ATP-dependent Clp protease adaptor protein ClpS
MVKEKLKPASNNEEVTPGEKELILFNDEVNTFDHVIDTLIEVCGHDPCQAEQCALTAHYNGRCGIKSGTFDVLKPVYDEMTNRELTVSISS